MTCVVKASAFKGVFAFDSGGLLPGETRSRMLSVTKRVEVRQMAQRADTILRWVRSRTTERGVLEGEFAVRQVWTIYERWTIFFRVNP